MKIAIDCRMSGKSGIGAFLDGILPFLMQSGHELLLLTPERWSGHAQTSVRTIHCHIRPFSLRELLFFPRRMAREINACDVFVSPYCNIPSGIRIPLFITIHDVVFLDMPELAGHVGTWMRKCLYRHAIRRAYAIFTVSEFSKSRIAARLRCTKPIHVVYNGVPVRQVLPSEEPVTKTDSILFVGNIKKHKGLSVLLPAFLTFRERLQAEERIAPRLILVGSQEHFRTKDESIAPLLAQHQDSICCTGHLSDAELHRTLRQARILVQPSLYEGFGIPPLEALYAGTKVILSDIAVFKEIYGNFPVAYFKSGDSADLAARLFELWHDTSPLPPLPTIYSYEKTAQRILETIERIH